MNSFESQFVTVGNKRNRPFKMSYKTYGNGANKVLFVMGYMMAGKFWSSIPKAYTSQPEKYTVCTFDHTGLGESEFGYFTSFKDLASDVSELLEHLKWDKTHFVATSVGSAISYELAGMKPDLFKSLNIISLPPFFGKACVEPGFRQFLNLPIFSKLYNVEERVMYSRLMVSDSFANSPSKIKKGMLNKDFVYPLVMKMHDTRYDLKYLSRFSYWYSAAFHNVKPLHYDDSEILKRPFPIAMFYGDLDGLICHKSMKSMIDRVHPNFIYYCMNAGHCLQTEEPDKFNKISQEFIDFSNTYKTDTIEQQEQNQFLVKNYFHFNQNHMKTNSKQPFSFKSLFSNFYSRQESY